MESVYCTFDKLDPNTGAGKVCLHEIEALKRVTNVELISRGNLEPIEKLYGFNPFLMDYFAADLLPRAEFAHLSCSPGMAILNKVKPKKYVVNIVAHDLKTSIEEHERYYGAGTYPFKHNTDPYLHKLLLKHAEKADVIITPSSGSAKWIQEKIRKENVRVIPHGVDPPKEVTLMSSGFNVGYLGPFGPDKGLIYLLMAWNHLNLKGTELFFAGSCCQSLEPWVKSLCPNGKTKLLGWVKEPRELYDQVSVYVQPSVTEGFGIPVLEAMAHGRPVIISSGAGSSDLVENGVDGFVVPPKDPKAIAERIQWFYDNPSEIPKMGVKAMEKSKDYTWDKIGERYEEMYKELVQ